MKKILALSLVLALGGCTSTNWGKISTAVGNTIAATNNTLANISENSLPAACGIVRVADGYFQQLKGRISADKIAIEAKAMASVNVICNNPPKNISAAFNTLLNLWFTIQDATKTN